MVTTYRRAREQRIDSLVTGDDKGLSLWGSAWQRLRVSPLFWVGAVIVGLFLLLAIFGPLFAPHDPGAQVLIGQTSRARNQIAPPQEGFPLGGDTLGRDLFSRMLVGSRQTLLVGVLATTIGLIGGLILGITAGAFGGWVDTVIMRIVDLNLAFPLILLALAVVALLGASLRNLVIVMAITTWMIYARVVRGLTLALREQELVQAIRALGAHDTRIIARHVLPNVLPALMVIWTLEVARVILMESALSFLGLGVPPPTPTWGRMLAEGRDYLVVAGWISIFPGIAIMVTVLGINFLGDGLRDLLDPRLRQQT